MSINNKYATGYDGIPIMAVKNAKELLVKPLTHEINPS